MIEYLRVFTQENDRVPTFTDFKRDYLPSYEAYSRRFGSMYKARQAANLSQDFGVDINPMRWKQKAN